jgi:lysophospholipase L1-like esterase
MDLRAKLSKAAFAGAAAVLALALVEGGLRAFAPVRTTGIRASYEYDPELGVRLKPGASLAEVKDFREEIHTNRAGTVNFEEDLAGYPKKAFALGDSYTQGTGVPSDASYPFALGLGLNLDAEGRHRKRWAVVNLGLAAYGGEQSLLALRRYRESLGRPDVVLYLGCDNDADDDRLFLAGRRHRHLVDGNPRYGALLGVLQRAAGTEIGKRIALARGGAGGSSAPAGAPVLVAAEQAGVLERLHAACAETRSPLVVSWYAPGASYEWLRRWAADKGVAFADWAPLAASVQADLPALPRDNDHSGGHHRAWVNRIIAEEMARQILRVTADR